jgi:glycosidase
VRELVAALRPETAWPAPFLLGETFTGPGEHGPIRRNLGPHGLDGQFDFPLMWALRGFAAWGSLDAAGLAQALDASESAWQGAGATMSPFVGNHDVSRFLSEAAGDRTDAPWSDPPPQPEDDAPYAALVLAQALALTLPGAPVLWQGDELGLAGATDPDCRRPLPDPAALSEAQAWVLERVRRIGRARRCLDALRRGARVPLAAEGQVIAYLRDADDGAPALIVANAGAAETRLQLRLPAGLAADPDTWHRDVIEGRDLVVLGPDATLTLTVPGRSARLFVPATGTCAESP